VRSLGHALAHPWASTRPQGFIRESLLFRPASPEDPVRVEDWEIEERVVIEVRRWVLSKKDRKKLGRELSELYPEFSLDKYSRIEIIVEDDVELYVLDGIPAFIRAPGVYGGRLIPHLLFLLRRGYDWLPVVIVDRGAVRPVSRGADLMRPGIVEIRRPFKQGDIFVVTEPDRGLPLAVHEALYDSTEIAAMEKGRVGKSLHHVGDRFWKLGEKA
jgi:PUA domain protein